MLTSSLADSLSLGVALAIGLAVAVMTFYLARRVEFAESNRPRPSRFPIG
jgi:hypothetical protein